jgi:hypothetical protein
VRTFRIRSLAKELPVHSKNSSTRELINAVSTKRCQHVIRLFLQRFTLHRHMPRHAVNHHRGAFVRR